MSYVSHVCRDGIFAERIVDLSRPHDAVLLLKSFLPSWSAANSILAVRRQMLACFWLGVVGRVCHARYILVGAAPHPSSGFFFVVVAVQRVCLKAFFECNIWADAVAIARQSCTAVDDTLLLRCFAWFLNGRVSRESGLAYRCPCLVCSTPFGVCCSRCRRRCPCPCCVPVCI